MEYDKRIICPKDNIQSCFSNTSEEDIYTGLEGYFTDALSTFANLDNCYYGFLENIDWNSDYPFYTRPVKENNLVHYAFFLPARNVKPEEKKYRPFANTKEFFEKTGFEVGDTIHVLYDDGIEYHLMLVGWSKDTLILGNMDKLNFKELFKWFKLWDGENKFIPFGVEE